MFRFALLSLALVIGLSPCCDAQSADSVVGSWVPEDGTLGTLRFYSNGTGCLLVGNLDPTRFTWIQRGDKVMTSMREFRSGSMRNGKLIYLSNSYNEHIWVKE